MRYIKKFEVINSDGSWSNLNRQRTDFLYDNKKTQNYKFKIGEIVLYNDDFYEIAAIDPSDSYRGYRLCSIYDYEDVDWASDGRLTRVDFSIEEIRENPEIKRMINYMKKYNL